MNEIKEKSEIVEKIKEYHGLEKSKNEIMDLMFGHRVPPSIVEKIIRDEKLKFRKSAGYREWTVEAFHDNPNLSREEWESGISEYLKDIQNYKQLYEMISSVARGLEKMERINRDK